MDELSDWGRVWCASGARGFFGENFHRHHLLLKFLGLTFRHTTLVAKSITVNSRNGFLPLDEKFLPREWFPSSIIVNHTEKVILNSVGLANPGIVAIIKAGRWQALRDPFIISYAPSFSDKNPFLPHNAKKFVKLYKYYTKEQPLKAPVALQVNLSCPNANEDPKENALDILQCLSELNLPLIPKVSFLWRVDFIARLAALPAVKGLCVGNSVPYGASIPALPTPLDWNKLFKTSEHANIPFSPLTFRGFTPGGLSGAYLLKPTLDCIRALRRAGIKKHINAGGGILKAEDAKLAFDAGADSISLGAIAWLSPWEMRSTIRASL